MKPGVLAALIAVLPLIGGTEQSTPKVDVVIHAGRLMDGVGTSPREKVSVLIAGDRIASVQDGWATPAGANVIDLRTSTVMPGFIDSHTHITGEGTGNAIVRAVTETPLDDAVRSTVYARRTLEAGFTTIRNVGADGGADVALKRAIERRARRRPAYLDGAHDAQHHRRPRRSGRTAARPLGRADLDGRHRRQRRRGAKGRALSAQVRRRSDQDHRDRRRAVDRRLRRRAAVHRRGDARRSSRRRTCWA